MSEKRQRRQPTFLKTPRYVLYGIWAELYTRWQENFNPKWHEPLPSIPCQFCGQTNHKEAYCPNLVKMGFILPPDEKGDAEPDNQKLPE